ncbi:MAG: AAA family ATPase [Blautia obeum]
MEKNFPLVWMIFEKLIREDFYYVDKTEMIADLLRNWGEVNLFTRPRRFGKSLNMNMLKSFLKSAVIKTCFRV